MPRHATLPPSVVLPPALRSLDTPIADLRANPRNPRTHSKKQIAKIADSIRAFGFTVPLAVDETGTVLAGNGRLAAAKLLGLPSVPVVRIAQEKRLRQAESWFSVILSGVKDFALLSLNANGRVQSWNKSGERLTGHAGSEIVGHTLNVIYPPDEAVQGRALQQIDFARRDGWHIDEGWRRRKDGRLFWCQSLVSALEEKSGEVSGFSVVLRDVTEQKTNGEELRRLLTTDQLTGLSNRARFFELAEAEVARFERFETPLSCLMIDVDHFKQVNDRHGHAGGDQILRELADLFRRGLRSIDVAGRLGGEEFAILLPAIDLAGARAIAELLRSSVEALRPIVEGSPVPFTISIGCAGLESPMGSIDGLLRSADRALYEAKRGGRNRVAMMSGPEGDVRQQASAA